MFNLDDFLLPVINIFKKPLNLSYTNGIFVPDYQKKLRTKAYKQTAYFL